MSLFGVSRGHVGLDIGTSAVRAAEVSAGRSPVVTRFGQVLLPRGAVVDGEVQEPGAVADALTTLWKRAGFRSRRVRLGVANRRVVVRQLELPAMSRSDLDSAIRFQAQEYIPIPLADAVMDFEVLEEFMSAEGQATQRVLVVAAERGMVDPLLEAVQRAKLEPVVLELNAYPLIRALGAEDVIAAGVQAIVDVGGGGTNIVIHQNGKIRFTRMLPTLGGDDFTNVIADQLGLEWDEAEALKHRASEAMRIEEDEAAAADDEEPASDDAAFDGAEETEPIEDPFADLGADDGEEGGLDAFDGEGSSEEPLLDDVEETDGDEPPNATPEFGDEVIGRARDILVGVMQRFTAEIRGSVDFYTTQAGASELSRVVVTGGGSLLGDLVEQVGLTLRTEAEPGRVFGRVPVGKVKLSQEQISIAEPFLAVAVGLALGGLEE